jgi:hypothetical protein
MEALRAQTDIPYVVSYQLEDLKEDIVVNFFFKGHVPF